MGYLQPVYLLMLVLPLLIETAFGQDVSIRGPAPNVYAVLPREGISCNYDENFNMAPAIQWFRDGVELVNEPGRMEIQLISGGSLLKFIIADSIVPGNYTCRATLDSIEAMATQEILPAVYSLRVQGDTDLLPEEDLLLLCNFTSSRIPTGLNWVFNGTTQTNEIVNITNVSLGNGGQYVCTLQFTLTTLVISVDVNIHDEPILQPNATALERKDTNISIDCNITGVGLQYNWTFRGEEVKKSDRISFTGGKLNIVEVGFSDAGMYTCFVENRAGNATQFHELIVFGPPDIIAPNSTTVDVAVNNRASLFCKSVSYPDSSTSWMHYPAAGGDQLGRSVPGANTRFVINSSEELVITSAAMEDAGAFQCNVTNEHGSATINITLIVVDAPEPPTLNQNGLVPQTTSVQVTWSQSVPSQFRRVEQYTVELSTNGGPFVKWTGGVINGDMRSFQVTNLNPGVNYRLRMQSRNIAGMSGVSNIVSFQTSTSPPELDFFNYTALENGRSILFHWRLLHDGGAAVSSFRITLQSDNAAERSQDLNINDNRILMTGLEPNTTYRVTVLLSNQLGGAPTIMLEITTPQGPPSRPSKPLVERSGLTLTSFKLTFIVDSAGSGPITHCIVNATSTTGEILRVFNVTVTVSPAEGSAVQVQATVTGLERNVVYRFSVSAGGPYGHGEFSVLSDPQEIENNNLLYIVIAASVGAVVLVAVMLIVIIVCVYCAKRKKKLNRLTITDSHCRDFIHPTSSTSDNKTQLSLETSPPRELMPTFHSYTTTGSVLHHQRTHSASSTSSQKKEMISTSLAMSSSRFSPDYYNNSSFLERNGLMSPQSVTSEKNLMWPSTPSINRLSYDVDTVPSINYRGTDV